MFVVISQKEPREEQSFESTSTRVFALDNVVNYVAVGMFKILTKYPGFPRSESKEIDYPLLRAATLKRMQIRS
jgi:hypothetical protein